MNINHLRSLWILFWLGNAATWVAVRTLWMSEIYALALGVLSSLTIIAALMTAIRSRFRRRTVIVLLCGLLIGQWWAVETGLLRAYWALSGFAR